jgi:hypothetical protein
LHGSAGGRFQSTGKREYPQPNNNREEAMKKFCSAAVFALLTVAAPARAAIIEWNLDDVAEIGNPSVTFTGFFDYDTVANAGPSGTSPNFNITELVGATPTLTFSPTNSTSFFDNLSSFGLGPRFGLEGGSAGDAALLELIIANNGTFDGSVPLTPLFRAQLTTAFLTPQIEQVQLSGLLTSNASAVPLPAALPLFGSGVMMLAGFAVRRRGKVS